MTKLDPRVSAVQPIYSEQGHASGDITLPHVTSRADDVSAPETPKPQEFGDHSSNLLWCSGVSGAGETS